MVHISDNMHEEICTYEVCKLAKEKGFDEYVEAFYAEDCNIPHTQGPEKWNEYKGRYAAPTQSQLQRWLREEKKIIVEVFMDDDSDTPLTYNIHQYKNGNWKCVCHHHGNYYSVNDWELCLEDALKYTFKKLIK